MSEMESWAREEVILAMEKENPDMKFDAEGMPTEFDYGCACYKSALEAFQVLCNQGHSGYSIQLTKQILNRLIDGKPLTPIEDVPEAWNQITDTKYQCRRCSGLFKHILPDGSVKYSYIDHVVCVDIANPLNRYSSGLVRSIVEEMYPITMPFMPSEKPIYAYCEEFLTDKRNGDFDTMGIIYLDKDGESIEVNRFFKEGTAYHGWDEISKEEYDARKAVKIN